MLVEAGPRKVMVVMIRMDRIFSGPERMDRD
jgi:hypothetical protein